MRTLRWLTPALSGLILLMSACGGGQSAPAGSSPASTAASPPASSAAASPSGSTSPLVSASASASTSASPSSASVAGSASGAAKPAVTIGSTNFTEQSILGEIYAQALEAQGYTVHRKFNLGTREIVEPALQSGQIDMEVDYMATLLAFVDKSAKGSSNPATTENLLRAALKPKGLSILNYAPAVDTNGVAVTQATAQKDKLSKISDLSSVAPQMILGGPPECPKRPFCLIGLEKTYGLHFKQFKPLDSGGPITVAALKAGQVNAGVLFTTDASIAVNHFVLLKDDKHLQLSDNIVPVVRDSLLSKAPADFKTTLNTVSAKLTTARLTELNKQVGVDREDAKTVAAAWLKSEGLVK
ncbi:MAG: ABC transporter substrate-binding protein [Chloroflexota bacterium]